MVTGLPSLPKGCERSPHVLNHSEEVRICAGLERDDEEEGKPHRADEENHLLDEETWEGDTGRQAMSGEDGEAVLVLSLTPQTPTHC